MEPVPLVSLPALSLYLGEPVTGAELAARGIQVVDDDLGLPSVSRAVARDLLTEQRVEEQRKAAKRAEAERRAVEADQAFRARLPRGIPADAVPAGLTAAELMMAVDPMDEASKRESVVAHALAHRDGAIVYHPIERGES